MGRGDQFLNRPPTYWGLAAKIELLKSFFLDLKQQLDGIGHVCFARRGEPKKGEGAAKNLIYRSYRPCGYTSSPLFWETKQVG